MANLVNIKCQKMIETLAHGYSSDSTQQEHSNEYPHALVKMIITSALEGLVHARFNTTGSILITIDLIYILFMIVNVCL